MRRSGEATTDMRIDLSSPVRKYAFLTGSAVTLFFFFLLTSQAIAEHWLEQQQTIARFQCAARIQWLNAMTQERLGVTCMDAAHGDFAAAEEHLRRSLQIDPHSARAWLELADVYEAKGEGAQRADAVRHALAAEPHDTRVQWVAANLFIGSDLNRGLSLLRAVAESDPTYTQVAISVAMGASDGDIDRVMSAVPEEVDARLLLMHYLVERNQGDAADRVWPTALKAPGEMKAGDILFYVDSLIGRHHPESAWQAWTTLSRRDPAIHLETSNLVTNGDFEGDLLNGGFGWRYTPTPGVTASLDTSTFHGGGRSLSLQVDGENIADLGFSQLVPVEPGAHYQISGWLHGEELEGAHGISVSVSDAYSHANLLLTDEALGSFPWREIDGEFAAPAGTQLVKLAVVRSVPNGRIRGKLWLDELRIEKK